MRCTRYLLGMCEAFWVVEGLGVVCRVGKVDLDGSQ